MAEFPAMPLWTDAYLGDTTHLTTVEHGAYFLLLIVAWRSKEGTLPDDDTMLARYSKLSATQWKKIRPILEPFFRIENGVWTQGRLSDERAAVKNNSSRQSDKAKARWLKTNKTSDAVAMPDSCRDDASLTLPLPQKEVVVISAREDEPPELPQQVTLSKRIGQITGWDASPNWFGDYSRLEAWLHSGWDAELDILPTITRIVAQRKARSQDIPKTLNYFEQAVANAHATRLAPTPKGTPNENGRKPKKSIGEQAADILASLGHSEPDQGFSGHLRGAEGVWQAD